MTTGELIKKARVHAGLTQKELSDRIGVSYQMIQAWENNRRNPKIESLQRIAEALNVDVSEFLTDNTSAVQKFKEFYTNADANADSDFEEKYNSLTAEEKELFGKYIQAMAYKLKHEIEESQKTAYSVIKDALDAILNDLPSSPNNNPKSTGKPSTDKK